MHNFWAEESGQTTTEYMLIIAAVVAGILAAAYFFFAPFQEGVETLAGNIKSKLAEGFK